MATLMIIGAGAAAVGWVAGEHRRRTRDILKTNGQNDCTKYQQRYRYSMRPNKLSNQENSYYPRVDTAVGQWPLRYRNAPDDPIAPRFEGGDNMLYRMKKQQYKDTSRMIQTPMRRMHLYQGNRYYLEPRP